MHLKEEVKLLKTLYQRLCQKCQAPTNAFKGEAGRSSKQISKRIEININQEAMDALNNLKITLTSEDVMLAYPDLKRKFFLKTDAIPWEQCYPKTKGQSHFNQEL